MRDTAATLRRTSRALIVPLLAALAGTVGVVGACGGADVAPAPPRTAITDAPRPPAGASATARGRSTMELPMRHPIRYVEIPVTDLERAMGFYAAVLDLTFERRRVDGYDMALFPFADGAPGASGALAKGDVYVPSKTGAIVYFAVADIDTALARARARGAAVLYPKTAVGEGAQAAFVAEIEDSEGNRLALHVPAPQGGTGTADASGRTRGEAQR